jgi:hypothetical protein
MAATVDATGQDFEALAGSPGVIGAVDASHIPVGSVPAEQHDEYINRKMKHSVIFMAVCNAHNLHEFLPDFLAVPMMLMFLSCHA